MEGGNDLRFARERSRAALRRGASMRELRDAAIELGQALCAVAEDGDMWERLASGTGASRAAELSRDEITQLDVIVGLDWARLLNESGYVPPPPAEVQASDLQRSIAKALTGDAPTDLDATREKLRGLCKTLVEAGEGREVSRRDLRKRLSTGMRVSGKLLVVIGAVALTGVAAAPLAAVLGVPVLLAHIGAGLVCEASGRLLERELDRGIDQPEGDGWLDPADAEALGHVYAMRTEALADLIREWRAVAEGAPLSDLVDRTLLYLDEATREFYKSWDPSSTTVWYRDLEDLFLEVNDRRMRLRELLEKNVPPDPEVAVDGLARFADLAARLQMCVEMFANDTANE